MNRKRNPDETRSRILDSAFQEIHAKGFSGASLDDIAARSGVTKGALYHHFPTKNDLGYAVVEEIIGPYFEREWARVIEATSCPLDAIRACIEAKVGAMSPETARLGCPLNNLMQEMSGMDEGFRLRLRTLVERWTSHISAALRRGQADGTVRPDLDVESAAHFMVAAIEGMAGLAKNSGEQEVARRGLAGFVGYLETLKNTPPVAHTV